MHAAKQINGLVVKGSFQRVLLIAAQPSDIIVAAGELIQFSKAISAAIRVILMTDGDRPLWLRRNYVDASRYQAILKCRQHVAEQALMTLGVARDAVHFFKHSPGELSEGLLTRRSDYIDALVTELEGFKPTLVVAPSRCDLNPDNNAIGIITALALGRLSDTQPDHLAYVIEGPPPAIPLTNRILLPQDDQRVDNKRRALHAMGAPQEQNMKDSDPLQAMPPELFIDAESKAQIDTQFCAMQNDCKTHLALENRTGNERLWLYPGVTHMHPARIGLQGSGSLQLGSRQSDLIQVARDASGVTMELGAYVDPLWIKMDSGPGTDGMDLSGWQRVMPVLNSGSDSIACVLTCYNVSDAIMGMLNKISQYVDIIVAVDDGSTDNTLAVLEQAACEMPSLRVLTHARSRGRGHALLAGIRYALATTVCGQVVIMNTEPPFKPVNIPALVAAQRNTGSVMTIGVPKEHDSIPLIERVCNRLASVLMHIKYHEFPADIRSDFRIFTRAFAISVLEQINGDRYTTDFRILTLALRKYSVASVAIDVVGDVVTKQNKQIQQGASFRMLAALLRSYLSRPHTSLKLP